VAHWTPRKRILDALEVLRLTSDGVTCDLVGETDRDPAYAVRVRRMLATPELAGRVEVHGQVSSERLSELYAAADALLLCSSYEGYGMVLAEGLAAGLPIVATRVGAVPEVVRDGFDADLVGAGDIAGLARALERLARDPAERERRAALAREHAASLPTWDNSVAAFEQLLVRKMSVAR
jgi:glycosyltransferase involved in cell wall biosynthesis